MDRTDPQWQTVLDTLRQLGPLTVTERLTTTETVQFTLPTALR